MRTVGIVIPVLNQLFYTKQVLKSIASHKVSEDTTIVVCIVDNASTDGTAEFLKGWLLAEPVGSYERDCIHNETNVGFGPACNQGMKAIIDQHPDADLLIMNNDMELLEGCVDALVETAYKKSTTGIVGGRLLFPDGLVQHAGAFLSVWGWGQHKGAGGKGDDLFNQQEEEEEEYVTGALLLIKNELYKKIGGFDERFAPAYFEEVDFCREARKVGYRTIYSPGACAIHYENTTGKAIYGNLVNVNQVSHKNQVKYYLKHDTDNASYVPISDDKLLLVTKVYGEWSFAHVMRNLAKGLSRAGVDVAIAPEEYHLVQNMEDFEIKEMILKPHDWWDRTVLRSSEGDHMYVMPPGKKRIAHTTGEGTRINREWREQLNHVDQVLTTSSFFKNVLEENGVKTPVSILPNTVDISKFNPGIKPYPMQGLRGLNFVSMFHFGERKAPELLFKAFCEEFRGGEDVTLTVHSLSMAHVIANSYGKSIKDWLYDITGTIEHAPIFVTANYMAPNLVPHFLKNFDVFVMPTRAEGFGLPPLEAAALGIPSIITGYSGVLDVVSDKTGWLLDYKLVDTPLQILPYFQNYIGSQWAEPSIEHLRYLMRYVYNHRDEVKSKGEAALQTAQNFSIEKIGMVGRKLIFGG